MTMGIAFSKAETNEVTSDTDDDIATARSEAGKLFSIDIAPNKKIDAPRSTVSNRLAKPRNQITSDSTDDILSKSTESTRGSPEIDFFYPSRPFGPSSSRRNQDSKLAIPGSITTSLSRVGWFRPRSSSGRPKSSKNTSQDESVPPSVLVINQMVPRRRQNQRTLPVKCPRKSQHHHRTSSSAEEEDIEQLKHMYDMRTWDMYTRITQARENRRTTTHNNNNHIPHATTTTATPNDCVYDHFYFPTDSSEEATGTFMTDHEMIFGDLD